VYVIGLTHAQAVEFPEHELEIWGHAHVDYDNMVPLRSPRPRSTRWQIVLAHGHYEADGVPPLRPSWLISDAEIEATGADYVALGHWNRPAQVGNGRVPAYYSGSPDLAGTVNVVRLGVAEGVVVRREKLRRTIAG
jgi:DNA repair exonuclease SbcCD nuclease subunit